MIFMCNSLRMSVFPGDFESAKSLKNYKKNYSRGVVFAITWCQRVRLGLFTCGQVCFLPFLGGFLLLTENWLDLFTYG